MFLRSNGRVTFLFIMCRSYERATFHCAYSCFAPAWVSDFSLRAQRKVTKTSGASLCWPAVALRAWVTPGAAEPRPRTRPQTVLALFPAKPAVPANTKGTRRRVFSTPFEPRRIRAGDGGRNGHGRPFQAKPRQEVAFCRPVPAPSGSGHPQGAAAGCAFFGYFLYTSKESNALVKTKNCDHLTVSALPSLPAPRTRRIAPQSEYQGRWPLVSE